MNIFLKVAWSVHQENCETHSALIDCFSLLMHERVMGLLMSGGVEIDHE